MEELQVDEERVAEILLQVKKNFLYLKIKIRPESEHNIYIFCVFLTLCYQICILAESECNNNC